MNRLLLAFTSLIVFIVLGRIAAADEAAERLNLLTLISTAGSQDLGTSTVDGRVVDGEGAPILRALVFARDEASGEQFGEPAFTDANGDFSIEVPFAVSIEQPAMPVYSNRYILSEVYPNPVNATSGAQLNLRYDAPADAGVPELHLYDVTGRLVDPSSVLASGVYFARLSFGDEVTEARQVVIVSPGPLDARLSRRTEGREPVSPIGKMAAVAGEDRVVFTVEKRGFQSREATYAAADLVDAIALTLAPAEAPDAAFTLPSEVSFGEAVVLDATTESSGEIQPQSFHWDFGDGRRGGGNPIAHLYAEPGTYNVTLTVSSADGATSSVTETVTVLDDAEAPGAPIDVVVFVRDVQGNAVADAQVQRVGGSSSVETNVHGMATLTGVPTGARANIRISKPGYGEQRVVRTFEPKGDGSIHVPVTLSPRAEAIRMDGVEFGGEAVGDHGVRVTIPVEGLIDAAGNIVTGAVDVHLTPIDVSTEAIDVFPGEFRGLMPDGDLDMIASLGVAEYVFTQSGERLNLAPGVSASIEIPVYTDGAEVGMELPLWSMNELTGLWTKEGLGVILASDASPSGLAMRADVSHFTWWNIDVPINRSAGNWPGTQTEFCPTSEFRCTIDGQEEGVRCDVIVRAQLQEGPTFRIDRQIASVGSTINAPREVELDVSASAARDGLLYVGREIVALSTCPADINVDLTHREAEGGEALRIEYGDDARGSLVDDGIQEYIFDADEDDYVRIRVVRLPGSEVDARIDLLDPHGVVLVSETLNRDESELIRLISETGAYRIRIAQLNATGGYGISLRRHTDDARDIDYGDIQREYFYPNRMNRYTFHAEAGDVFRAEVDRGNRFWNSSFSLRDAADQELMSVSGSRHITYLVQDAGEYSLMIQASPASNRGEYRIMLSGAGMAEAREIGVGGEQSDVVSMATMRRYHVPAQAEDHVMFAHHAAEQSQRPPWISVLTSDGAAVGHGIVEQNRRYLFNKAVVDEEYVLVVTGALDAEPVEFRLETDRHEPVGAAFVPGDTIRGFIYPGEVETFEHDARSGTAIRAVAAGEGDFAANGLVRVLGNELFEERNFSGSVGGIAVGKVDAAGPHTVELRGVNANSHGGYWLVIHEHDVIDDGLVVDQGSRLERGMFDTGEVQTYHFHGQRGDMVRIQAEPHPSWNSRLASEVTITGPGGVEHQSMVNFQFDMHAANAIALPEDGTYSITLTKGGSSSQSGTYTLSVMPVTGPAPVVLPREFAARTIEIDDAHDVHRYEFPAEAGSWHRFMVQPGFSATPRGTVNVVNPSFESEGTATFRSSTFQSDRRAGAVYFHAEQAGTHTAMVFGERAVDQGEVRIRWSPAVSIDVGGSTGGFFREDEFYWYSFEVEETRDIRVRFWGDAFRAALALEAADGSFAVTSSQANVMTRTLQPGRYFFGVRWTTVTVEGSFTVSVEALN